MKNFNFSLFFGCCVISIGIIIAGLMIANHLPPTISGNFSGTIMDSATQQPGEYLSEYDASAFLMMNTEDFVKFIQSGELKGTYTVIQGNNVFSKEKLSEWIKKRIENQ